MNEANLSDISFDELFQAIKRGWRNAEEFLHHLNASPLDIRFKNIQKSIDLIHSKPISKPPRQELYLRQWQEYNSGQREGLDSSAIRYLCWEPSVASDVKFISYLEQVKGRLNSRAIQGLVRSYHCRWDTSVANSWLAERLKGILHNFKGSQRVLAKWRESLSTILGSEAPRCFAKEILLADFRPIKENIEEWALDGQSAFIHEAVKLATVDCREMIRRNPEGQDYFLKELLGWGGWELSAFKKEIENTILHKNSSILSEKIQSFILGHANLGDPRLPRNNNWLGISDEAKKVFISWLSRRDIIFFFEHVLPKGSDPHGRKDFWLRYVNNLRQSRPLLSEDDRLRLSTRTKDVNYGRISGQNSAFILDFGTIVCVEFSVVGACYIYPKNDFDKMVPELFASRWFSEKELKVKGKAIGRVIHRVTVNTDWRYDVESFLAKNGIRPN